MPTDEPTITSTSFDPSDPRPYRWVILVTVEAGELQVADGFNPFVSDERDLSPREMLDNLIGNIDTWGEMAIEVTDLRVVAAPDVAHIRRAQGETQPVDVSERDRQLLAETLGRLLDTDGMTIEKLQDFCEGIRSEADGAYVDLVSEVVNGIEHPEC